MKKKPQLVEDLVFDNYEFAQNYKEKTEAKQARLNIALIASFLSSIGGVCFVLGKMPNSNFLQEVLILIYILGLILGYCLGGIKSIFKVIGNAFVWGWYLVPIFPADLVVECIVVTIALLIVLFCPVVCVFLTWNQTRKDYNEACAYVKCFKPANANNNEL